MDKKIANMIIKDRNFQPDIKGQEIIKFIAKTLPHQPGVYQMEDEAESTTEWNEEVQGW
mgnify:CR=1 FL=1